MSRILLYEDETSDARELLKAMRVIALKLGCPDITVVWFGKAPQLDKRDPRRMRLTAATAVEVDSLGNEVTHTDRTWWQSHFDAAVLDVYDAQATDVALHFLRWLAFAEFEGPVVVTSLRDTPVGSMPELVNFSTIQKNDGWALATAEIVLRQLQARDLSVPVVGSRGRDPRDVRVLHDFFSAERCAHRRSLTTWSGLWIGTDADMKEKVDAFFPSMQFLDPDSWTRDHGGDLRKSWPAYLATRTGDEATWPRAIWFDCGRQVVLTDVVCDTLLRQIASFSPTHQASALHFAVFVLATRATISQSTRLRLRRQGVVPLSREELHDTPGLWLEDTMEGFAKRWRALTDIGARRNPASQRHLDMAAATAEYYLRALLVAHSKSRLVGQSNGGKGAFSPVRWFASTPHSGSRINQTILRKGYFIDAVWAPLRAQQLIDDRLRGFFEEPRQP